MDDYSAGRASQNSGVLFNLELIRGLAAVFVVMLHATDVFRPIYFPISYFAVDIFFVMSGFVIARSYEKRLIEERLSKTDFLIQRVIRLYPLILVGVLLSAVSAWATGTRIDPAAFALNLFVLPSFTSESMFLDGPMWSLFFEFFGSLCFALGLYRMRSAHLMMLLAGAFFMLLIGALLTKHNAFSLGYDRRGFIFGFPRVLLGFLWGQLLFRWSRHRAVRGSTLVSVALVGLCLLPLALPLEGKWPQILLGSVCLLGLFPLFVYGAAQFNPGLKGQRVFEVFGAISYPLYIVHAPIAALVGPILLRISSPPICGFILLPLLAAISFGLDKAYDRPVRRTLQLRVTGNGANLTRTSPPSNDGSPLTGQPPHGQDAAPVGEDRRGAQIA